ncbi:hypothetical protein ASL19_13835 [Cylindrospermopsis sp. CR12]|nr:hypothetical protein ASL19_13835 [Cylindrospermopsis sp. CR12]
MRSPKGSAAQSPIGIASRSPSKYPQNFEITDLSVDGKRFPSTFYQMGTEHEMSLDMNSASWSKVIAHRECFAIARRECFAIAHRGKTNPRKFAREMLPNQGARAESNPVSTRSQYLFLLTKVKM